MIDKTSSAQMPNGSSHLFRRYRWIFILWLVLNDLPGLAQADYNRWYFGALAGIVFPANGGAPNAVSNSVMYSGEGCATISDANGNLLFYTNGIDAWNTSHRPMANGDNLGAFSDYGRSELAPNSATQGVAVVAKPGSSNEYYIFTLDAAENDLRNGLSYSVVDMSRQGGLGEVVRKAVRIPVPVGDGRITEKMTIVRHANERDIWVTVHGWGNNVFCSYLLTPAGISAAPVLSTAGSIHQGGRRGRINPYYNYNSIGAMKVSPDGRRLAVVQHDGPLVELFDFNHGTGLVSNGRIINNEPVSALGGNYGLEFSPNSNLLYVSGVTKFRQFNLLTQVATEIFAGSGLNMPLGALQLGPDGRIYHCNGQYLNVIEAPNQPGTGCSYKFNAVPLGQAGPGRAALGLPTALVRPPASPTPLATFSVAGTGLCWGGNTVFSASIYPQLPGATVTWDFGEPSAGTRNTATGLLVAHRYATVGTYTVTMTLVEANGRQTTYSQPLFISAPGNQLRIVGPGGNYCVGEVVTLTATLTPTTPATFFWQDGSVGNTLMASTSGVYWVEIYTPGVCTVRDSIRLNFQPLPVVDLGPDRPMLCEQSIKLDGTSSISGSTYRWQDGSTKATFIADLPGTYTVEVSSPAGCKARSSVRINTTDCPLIIPNIITPNGDDSNDAFVVKGITPGKSYLKIYNRWGKEVYKHSAYNNDWNARSETAGIYYYSLFVPVTNKLYKGWLEVIK